jgi:homocysteine S-methyltransferase
MTRFEEVVATQPLILTEGAIIERLRREFPFDLDPHIANAGYIYRPKLKPILRIIYRQYIDAVQLSGLPMLIFTPTWRANHERLHLAGFTKQDVNGDCVQFVQSIREEYGEYGRCIFIGGLMGCKGDAYKPTESLSTGEAHAFHQYQVDTLVGAGVDFLFGSTLPSACEALGLAHAMASSGCPYLLSFVIRNDGMLLDGLALDDTIATIDNAASPKPVAYMVNCIHSLNFREAYTTSFNSVTRNRVIGLQANTSMKCPEDLEESELLDTEDPDMFAGHMVKLHTDFKLKILGGCCGTNENHISALVSKLR